MLGVNVMGVVHGIKAFLPLIRAHGEGGHIVNTGSISSFFVREGGNQAAYCATKYAVAAISEGLEQELKGTGIGVSILCPGAVNTAIFDSAATRPDKFGGGYSRPTQEALKPGFVQTAIDPAIVGQAVVTAIRNDEFYILTHKETWPLIKPRFDRIAAAFAG